jgi:hypothetical protein
LVGGIAIEYRGLAAIEPPAIGGFPRGGLDMREIETRGAFRMC